MRHSIPGRLVLCGTTWLTVIVFCGTVYWAGMKCCGISSRFSDSTVRTKWKKSYIPHSDWDCTQPSLQRYIRRNRAEQSGKSETCEKLQHNIKFTMFWLRSSEVTHLRINGQLHRGLNVLNISYHVMASCYNKWQWICYHIFQFSGEFFRGTFFAAKPVLRAIRWTLTAISLLFTPYITYALSIGLPALEWLALVTESPKPRTCQARLYTTTATSLSVVVICIEPTTDNVMFSLSYFVDWLDSI